jgi:multiple sugar transport system substrate-binding protein
MAGPGTVRSLHPASECALEGGAQHQPASAGRPDGCRGEENHMSTSRDRSVALIAALALLVVACGSGGQGSASGALPAASAPAQSAGSSPVPSGSAAGSAGAALDASGDIFAFGVSYDTSDEIAKGRVDTFKELYPDVKVTFSESGFDSQGFLAALQGSDSPDVVRIPRDRLGTYVARGVLEPLDDCVARAGVDMANYREAAVKQVTVDGKLYAMPEFFWVSNWLVDDDLFEQAGLDPATWDVGNWDQITAANQALLDKTDAKVAIDPKVWDNGDRFPMWVAAAGGALLSDDGKTAQLDQQPVIDALTFTKSLIDAQGGLTKFKDRIGETGDFFGAENGFAKDLEAAFPMQQWYLNVLAGASPDTKFTALPFKTKDGQPMTYAEGDALAVVASSDNKDAACAFVTTMVSTDAWINASKLRQDAAEKDKEIQTGTSTGNRAADEQIFGSMVNATDNPTFKAALDAYSSTLDSSFALPATPAAEEFRQAWIDAVNKALEGSADPAAALQAAQQEAQSAIDGAGNAAP